MIDVLLMLLIFGAAATGYLLGLSDGRAERDHDGRDRRGGRHR